MMRLHDIYAMKWFTSASNDSICSTATTGWRLSPNIPSKSWWYTAVYRGLPLSW